MQKLILAAFLCCACVTSSAWAQSSPSELPDSEVNRLMKEGVKAYDNRDYAKALEIYKGILIQSPAHGQARLELGRTLYMLQQYDAARNEFEFVQKTFDPPPVVDQKIKAYLRAIERAQTRFSTKAVFSASAFYDSNVNFGPDRDLIRIAPLDFGFTTVNRLEVSPESQEKSSEGLLALATAQLQHDFGERGGWHDYVAGHYYQNFLADHTDFEVLLLGAAAGFRLEANDSVLELPVRFQDMDRGEDDAIQSISLQPVFLQQRSADFMVQTRGIFEMRDYQQYRDGDALYGELGRLYNWQKGDYNYTVHAGALMEEADEDAFSNFGLRAGVGAIVELIYELSLRGTLDYRGRWFDEEDVLVLDEREDTELTAALSLSRNITVNSGVSLLYQHTENISNLDLYDFDRDLVMLSAYLDY